MTETNFNDRKVVDLTYIHVPESHREKGIAKMMTDRFLDWASSQNYCVRLENTEVRNYVTQQVLTDKSLKGVQRFSFNATTNMLC